MIKSTSSSFRRLEFGFTAICNYSSRGTNLLFQTRRVRQAHANKTLCNESNYSTVWGAEEQVADWCVNASQLLSAVVLSDLRQHVCILVA